MATAKKKLRVSIRTDNLNRRTVKVYGTTREQSEKIHKEAQRDFYVGIYNFKTPTFRGNRRQAERFINRLKGMYGDVDAPTEF